MVRNKEGNTGLVVNVNILNRLPQYHKLDGEKALTGADVAHEHAIINEIVVSFVAMKTVVG